MKRAVVIACAVLLLAACGGGKQSAEDQIKAAYTGFFSPTGSLADHAALLEDGTKPDSPAQAVHFTGLTPATVSKVTLQGPNKATVMFTIHYSIYNFTDRTGSAVRQDGKWKVSSETVCGLIAAWGSQWPACSS